MNRYYLIIKDRSMKQLLETPCAQSSTKSDEPPQPSWSTESFKQYYRSAFEPEHSSEYLTFMLHALPEQWSSPRQSLQGYPDTVQTDETHNATWFFDNAEEAIAKAYSIQNPFMPLSLAGGRPWYWLLLTLDLPADVCLIKGTHRLSKGAQLLLEDRSAFDETAPATPEASVVTKPYFIFHSNNPDLACSLITMVEIQKQWITSIQLGLTMKNQGVKLLDDYRFDPREKKIVLTTPPSLEAQEAEVQAREANGALMPLSALEETHALQLESCSSTAATGVSAQRATLFGRVEPSRTSSLSAPLLPEAATLSTDSEVPNSETKPKRSQPSKACVLL